MPAAFSCTRSDMVRGDFSPDALTAPRNNIYNPSESVYISDIIILIVLVSRTPTNYSMIQSIRKYLRHISTYTEPLLALGSSTLQADTPFNFILFFELFLISHKDRKL